jgi:hypothetical protein
MTTAPRMRTAMAGAEELRIEPGGEGRAGLALGFLAMLPMLGAYEWSVVETGGGRRNAAELALSSVLLPLGPYAEQVRWILLGALGAFAFAQTRRLSVPVRGGVAQIVLEGILGAVALGPALVGLLTLGGDLLPSVELRGTVPGVPPSLARAGLCFGGAAYEELLFRVGAYGLLYLCTARTVQWLGGSRGLSRGLAEVTGLLGSSALFSAFHLQAVARLFGDGGEPLHWGMFTWRLLAGVLLGLLFRWRGPGVAAWAPGLFNLALLLGTGPDVLL